jgi:hypothetical protein
VSRRKVFKRHLKEQLGLQIIALFELFNPASRFRCWDEIFVEHDDNETVTS